MATVSETSEDDGIRRLNLGSARFEAGTRKLMAEAGKLGAEQLELSAGKAKLDPGVRHSAWPLLVQGLLAGAALFGAAAALARLFLT